MKNSTTKRKNKSEKNEKEIFFAINSRIRLIRNLKDFKFSQHLTTKEKKEIEDKVIKLFKNSSFNFSLINFNNLTGIEKELYKNKFYINQDYFTKNTNAIVLNNSNILILFNNIDHIKMIGVREGLDLITTFKEIYKIEEFLSQHLKFSFSLKYGYLSPKIKRCGIGLKLSVLLHLPGIILNEKSDSIFYDLSQRGYEVEPFYKDSFYYIVSSKINFGVSEEKLLERFDSGIKNLLEIDKNELMSFYNKHKKNSVDIISISYNKLNKIQEISYYDALKNISNILIGLTTNNLYFKKKIDILDFINSILRHNKNDKKNNFKDLDVIRGEIIRDLMSYIGEYNV